MNKAQNYFIVHYQDRSITGVIIYNRIQNHGRVVWVSNFYSLTHLSGISLLLSPGYFWHNVIYRLCRERRAQSCFYRQCIKKCQEKLGILFSTRDSLLIFKISY